MIYLPEKFFCLWASSKHTRHMESTTRERTQEVTCARVREKKDKIHPDFCLMES